MFEIAFRYVLFRLQDIACLKEMRGERTHFKKNVIFMRGINETYDYTCKSSVAVSTHIYNDIEIFS